MSSTVVTEPVLPRGRSATRPRGRSCFRNPWRHPWFLEGFTWLYLIWSLVPIAIAVLFSFNNGKSQATFQGLSMRWYCGDKVNSIWYNPQLHSAIFETLKLSVLHDDHRGADRGRLRARHQPVARQDPRPASTSS